MARARLQRLHAKHRDELHLRASGPTMRDPGVLQLLLGLTIVQENRQTRKRVNNVCDKRPCCIRLRSKLVRLFSRRGPLP